jgi:uncharacterized protein (TIGR03086 family)
MTDAQDPRPLLRSAFEQSIHLVGAVAPDQFGDPTPCTDFDVRALIGHMAFAASRIAAAGRRTTVPDDGPAITGVSDSDWPDVFEKIARDAIEAWSDDAALDGEIELPFGSFPAAVVPMIYAQEQVTHGWDLAVATGQVPKLDPALAEAVLPLVQQFVPPDMRGGEMPFGAIIEVPPTASVYDRLAGYLGRQPSIG